MPQGLAYSVSGGWNTTPADHVGTFQAGGETAKPVEFLIALQRVLEVGRLTSSTLVAVARLEKEDESNAASAVHLTVLDGCSTVDMKSDMLDVLAGLLLTNACCNLRLRPS